MELHGHLLAALPLAGTVRSAFDLLLPRKSPSARHSPSAWQRSQLAASNRSFHHVHQLNELIWRTKPAHTEGAEALWRLAQAAR